MASNRLRSEDSWDKHPVLKISTIINYYYCLSKIILLIKIKIEKSGHNDPMSGMAQ